MPDMEDACRNIMMPTAGNAPHAQKQIPVNPCTLGIQLNWIRQGLFHPASGDAQPLVLGSILALACFFLSIGCKLHLPKIHRYGLLRTNCNRPDPCLDPRNWQTAQMGDASDLSSFLPLLPAPSY